MSHPVMQDLEKSVAIAGTQLSTVTNKLNEVERNLDSANPDELDDVCVMELLESMTEVKKEYQILRKDIHEVQQLQRDVTSSIQYQVRCLQQSFAFIKKRLALKENQN